MVSTFSLDLTFAELNWLAGSFGMARLPITIPSVSQEELLLSQTSLSIKKMIEPDEAVGWRIHPFLSIAMQWMAQTPDFWVIYCYWRQGIQKEFVLFTEKAIALLVLPIDGGISLLACQDFDTALIEWQRAINLQDDLQEVKQIKWDFPTIITNTRSAWKRQDPNESMVDEFFTWAQGLEWIVSLSYIKNEQSTSRFVLALKDQTIFVSQNLQSRSSEFLISSPEETWLRNTLVQLLKSERFSPLA